MQSAITNGRRNGADENFAVKAATAVGSTAGYVQTHDIQQMMCDAEDVARRYPVPSLIGAAAFGLLLGAVLRRG